MVVVWFGTCGVVHLLWLTWRALGVVWAGLDCAGAQESLESALEINAAYPSLAVMSTERKVSQPASQPINQSVTRLNHQSVSQPINQSVTRLNHQSVSQSVR